MEIWLLCFFAVFNVWFVVVFMLCLCQLDQKMKQQIKEHSSTPPPLLTLKKPDARKNIHCKLSVCAHRPILIFLGIKCLTQKIFFACQGGVIIFTFPSQGNAKCWILSMVTHFLPVFVHTILPNNYQQTWQQNNTFILCNNNFRTGRQSIWPGSNGLILMHL